MLFRSEMVEALGYRIRRLFVGVFVAGSALAGLGGVMWGLYQQSVRRSGWLVRRISLRDFSGSSSTSTPAVRSSGRMSSKIRPLESASVITVMLSKKRDAEKPMGDSVVPSCQVQAAGPALPDCRRAAPSGGSVVREAASLGAHAFTRSMSAPMPRNLASIWS